MDYFVMQQDERYTDTPVLQNIRKKIDIRHMNRLRSHQIADTTIFQVKASTDTEYLDLLSNQLYLLSEKLKKLIAMYEPECIFKHIPLMDQFNSKQSLYFLPFFEEVEALSPSSEFNADRSVIKKLVLQGEKVAKKRIFRVQESEQPLIIVRLDVAESILRRDMIGVSLKKVLVE